MSNASILVLAAAIEAALAPLRVVNGGATLKLVDHWVGGFTGPEVEANLGAAVLSQAPAALIAFEREAAVDDVTMTTGEAETAATTTWSVIVVTSGAGPTAKRGVLAAYGLIDPVVGALNGLVIGAPVATLAVTIGGTVGATVTFGAARLVLDDAVAYAPAVPGAVLDDNGEAVVAFACVTPGALGDLPPATELTWNATPADCADTAVVASVTTDGAEGLLRSARLRYVGTRWFATAHGKLYALACRFTATREAPVAALPDASVPLGGARVGLQLTDTDDPVPPTLDPFLLLAAP